MSEAAGTFARKLLAAAILVVAAWVLFKLVIGLVSTIAWFLAVVVAVIAIGWAVRTL
jgi:hypothetical protein